MTADLARAITIGTHADPPDDLAYWLAKTPAERLAGIEFLRRQFFAYGKAESELRRLLEIAHEKRS